MSRAIAAGVAYFVGMFALGFALGTIRVLLLEPRFGAFQATMAELPTMLLVSWLACAWLVRRLAVPGSTGPRLLMGVVAFALLVLAEVMLGMKLFGRTLPAQAANMTHGAGLLGLIGQFAFAAFPLAQMLGRETGRCAGTPLP